MCGIFGIVQGKVVTGKKIKTKEYVNDLFILSESRGKEASGLAFLRNDKLTIYKEPIPSSKLIKTNEYTEIYKETPELIIGHSRLVTNGHQADNQNNQPIVSGSVTTIHNGIIVNNKDLEKRFSNINIKKEVDTKIAAGMIDLFYKQGYSLIKSLQKTYSYIEGSASLAILTQYEKELALTTNTGSLFIAEYKNPRFLVFASERYILEKFTSNHSLDNYLNKKIYQVMANTGVLINIENLKIKSFLLKYSRKIKLKTRSRHNKHLYSIETLSDKNVLKKDVTYLISTQNKINDLKKHVPPFRAIENIKRCAKCILPPTMPFISFNEHGVCNFCILHKSPKTSGKDSLEKYVSQFRKNGSPDCIVALSGGRDSSYGLHYVKNVLKLNPIAYTYDWGMITDIARRNQARMVGKLGIEHILVSANIKEKREHIRNHVLAWLKKPDLGMVPLFAAGDKQAEYYIEELKRKTGIELVIYCRGNEIEDERFKFGHLGIFDGTPKGVIHNLSNPGKLSIFMYYLKNYITNPSYIDSSIWDTLFAYATTYLMHHEFVYLWHYIPWNEKQIIKTLKKNYNWETSPDTTATWRIDDGTPSFYNYIYYVVQGFTEHDALRSNQIREGVISRNEALRLVNEENKPRYESLKWYFDVLGLDGHKVLTIVDKIPKLYPL